MARIMAPEIVAARAEAIASILWEVADLPIDTPAQPARPIPSDTDLYSHIYLDQRRWAVTGIMFYNSTTSSTPPPFSERTSRAIMAELLKTLSEQAGVNPDRAAKLPDVLAYLAERLARDVAPVLNDYRRIFQGTPRLRIVPFDAWQTTEAELWARMAGTSRIDEAEARAADAEAREAARVRWTREQRDAAQRARAIEWFQSGGRDTGGSHDSVMAADLDAVAEAAPALTGSGIAIPRCTRSQGTYAEQGLVYSTGCMQARARALTHLVEWAWVHVRSPHGVARATASELVQAGRLGARAGRLFAAFAATLHLIRRPVAVSPRGPHVDAEAGASAPQYYTPELMRNPWNQIPVHDLEHFRMGYLENVIDLPALNWSDNTREWARDFLDYCHTLPPADWELPRRWMLYMSQPVPDSIMAHRIPDEDRPLQPQPLAEQSRVVPGGKADTDLFTLLSTK